MYYQIKGWKVWILSCLLGSLLSSFYFVKWINSTNAFKFTFIDFITIALILLIVSLLLSTPLMIFIILIVKKKIFKKTFFIINLIFFIYIFFIVYLFSYFQLMNLDDSIEFFLPFIIVGVPMMNLYFMMARSRG
jgi:hypothetical protein